MVYTLCPPEGEGAAEEQPERRGGEADGWAGLGAGALRRQGTASGSGPEFEAKVCKKWH
jgi:hypothetical protein